MYCYPIYTIDTWSMLTINNPTLISMFYLYVIDIYSNIILSVSLLSSRSMILHNVTCHVTTVMCLFIIQEINENKDKNESKKEKEKRNQIKESR